MDFSSWFDFWHEHPDWYARGNRLPEMRKQVAAIAYRLLRYVEVLAEPRGAATQVWATICADTGNNAVYVHSENPNGTPFPWNYGDVRWGEFSVPELDGILDLASHEIGLSDDSEYYQYHIRRRAQADTNQ